MIDDILYSFWGILTLQHLLEGSKTPTPTPTPAPEFPTTIVLASVVIIVVGVGILAYYKSTGNNFAM